MITETLNPRFDRVSVSSINEPDVRFYHSLGWKAIFAGVAVAVGIYLLLITLSAAIGLGAFTPLRDQNPGQSFAIGTGIAWGICALVSFYVGGWMAGCFSAAPKAGGLHGIVVWSITMAITFMVASAGVLKAMNAGGETAASAVSDVAKTAVKQASDQTASFIDEASKSSPANAAPNTVVRGRREIGLAVTKLFGPGNDVNSTENQAALSQALTQYAGMSEANAKTTVDEWVTSYKSLQTELAHAKDVAAQKARQAAEETAKQVSRVSSFAFFVFLLGLIATVGGGVFGAKRTFRHTTLGVLSEN